MGRTDIYGRISSVLKHDFPDILVSSESNPVSIEVRKLGYNVILDNQNISDVHLVGRKTADNVDKR